MITGRLGILRRFAQNLGPYLMLEILLPGGTLLVLLLFLYRRRKDNLGMVAPRIALAVTRALDGLGETLHSPPRFTTIRSDR
jgi:hypothetical protein